jgi:hypothetical protein
MHVSEARIQANRKNALLSTGPKTTDGKNRSRANALKHGLCSAVLIPESADQVQARAVDLYNAFKPYTGYQTWHVDRAAVLTLRIERVEAIERRVRDKIRLKAELSWDEDKRLEAEVTGGLISKKPAETVELLRRTPQGCEWLMKRWAMLAFAAAAQNGQWTDEQASLAFDLLATPAMFRIGKPGAAIDLMGHVVDAADDSAAVARRMVEELEGRRQIAADLDEVDRALAMADLDHDKSSELRRLRRYEATLHTRLRFSVKGMEYQGMLGAPDPACYPQFQVNPEPRMAAEPPHPDEILAANHPADNPHPPFCLTPDEFPPIGQSADIPAVLKSRKQKRSVRADSLRESKRRKAKQLIA